MEKNATEPTGSKKVCGMTKNNKIIAIAIIAVVVLAGLYWQKHNIKMLFFKQSKTASSNQNKAKKSSNNNNQNTQDNTGNVPASSNQTQNQSQSQDQTNSQNAVLAPANSATNGY